MIGDKLSTLAKLEGFLPLLSRLQAQQDLTLQQQIAAKEDPTIVTTDDAQTIRAQKTFSNAPVRVLDGNGTLIHAFGAKS